MEIVVKNTTSWGLLDLLCPHTCMGCGQLGSVLCGCCKKNLFLDERMICPLCKRELTGLKNSADFGRCPECKSGLERIFVAGWREGVLAKMVKEYKYQSVRAIGESLVEILDHILAGLPQAEWQKYGEIVVVPLPTIGRHVRERGLDHTLTMAKKLAARRKWKMQKVLERAEDTVQVGSNAEERKKQAERAYAVRGEVDGGKTYLLLDDVWTTGASMLAAAEVMKKAGVKRVLGVVVVVGA